jgi:hypothetical protein
MSPLYTIYLPVHDQALAFEKAIPHFSGALPIILVSVSFHAGDFIFVFGEEN